MKLTEREKIMLLVLGGLLFIALAYFFMAEPQLNKLNQLSEERTKLQAEVVKAKEEISPDNKLNKDFEALNKKIEEKTARFYPAVLQDKIVVILDEMFKKSQLKNENITFTPVAVKPIEESKQSTAPLPFPIKDIADKIQKPEDSKSAAVNNSSNTKSKETSPVNTTEGMTANIQYSGSYEQLVSYIKEIEALNRTAVIKNFSATKGKTGLLTGTLSLEFYAIPKISQQDAQYYEWPYKNAYGKDNPFK